MGLMKYFEDFVEFFEKSENNEKNNPTLKKEFLKYLKDEYDCDLNFFIENMLLENEDFQNWVTENKIVITEKNLDLLFEKMNIKTIKDVINFIDSNYYDYSTKKRRRKFLAM